MESLRSKLLTAKVAAAAGFLLACSSQNSGTGGGTGGVSGSAGQAGLGGEGGTGGRSVSGGFGGTAASGGTSSSGGLTASGGTKSSGGSSASGGNSSSGGLARGGTTGTTGNSSAAGSGGKAGGGGLAAGTGGTTGSGGTAGTGGTTGTGGTSSGGGATGTGGVRGSGGITGTGGATGAGGAAATLDCPDISTKTYNFTKRYEDGPIALTGSTKTYYTMTNWWHMFGGQTVALNGLSMKLGNSQSASVPSTDGNPMGFPSMFIGTYQNKATVGSNLPKQVSDIKSVPTIFNTNSSTVDTSNLNATYDVWFTATSAPLSSATANNPGKGGAYLMVWLFKPEQRQPRGGSGAATGATPNYPATTVTGVTGKWDVWVDKTDPLCISYVASEPIDGLSFDLNNFIQDSVTKQYGITASMYLSLIFAGFEVWSGGDKLEATQFCATVN
jgi:hypothetical protein